MKKLWVLAILAAAWIGAASSSAQETAPGEQSGAVDEESAPAGAAEASADAEETSTSEAETSTGAEEASTGAEETSDTTPDFAVGESIYAEVCKNCHGPTARGMASFPRLVGHDAEYLVMRLEAYRAGERVGPNTALMAPWAAELTDADIASIALYVTTAFE